MGWIKFETTTSDKPEVWAMAEMLKIDPDAVVGKLLRVWAWFDEQTENGNAPSVTKVLLDRNVGVTGFVTAMLQVGWMIEDENGIRVPNFDRHNGDTAKKRAMTAKRVAENRASNAAVTKMKQECNAESVTSALPRKEKIREEKKINTKPPKSPKGDSGKVPSDLSGVVFPKELDNPLMREAVRKWVIYRKERKPAVTLVGLEQTLAMLARMPADVAIASIYRTIAKNWQGMQTCPPEELALFTPKEVAQAKHDAEERRKADLLAQARRQREIESRAMEARNAPATRT